MKSRARSSLSPQCRKTCVSTADRPGEHTSSRFTHPFTSPQPPLTRLSMGPAVKIHARCTPLAHFLAAGVRIVWIAGSTTQSGCARRLRIAVRKSYTAVAFSAREREPSLLSGALWPIASFGAPGGHSLSLGARAIWPSPEVQWMLSPVTGSLSVRWTRLLERSLPPLARAP